MVALKDNSVGSSSEATFAGIADKAGEQRAAFRRADFVPGRRFAGSSLDIGVVGHRAGSLKKAKLASEFSFS